MKLIKQNWWLLSVIALCVCLLSFSIFSKEETNNFIKSKVFEDLRFDVKYLSMDELIQRQIGVNPSRNERNELEESLKDHNQYVLKIGNQNGGGLLNEIINDASQYQGLVQYLSFDLQKQLFLCTSQDTIPCAFSHFERNYELAPFVKVEFGFFEESINEKLCEGEEWSILYDAEHLGLGPLFFNFESDKICKS